MAAQSETRKRIVVCGAGGFIGNHLVNRLKSEHHLIRGVDLKYPEFSPSQTDDFILGDLRDYRWKQVSMASFASLSTGG